MGTTSVLLFLLQPLPLSLLRHPNVGNCSHPKSEANTTQRMQTYSSRYWRKLIVIVVWTDSFHPPTIAWRSQCWRFVAFLPLNYNWYNTVYHSSTLFSALLALFQATLEYFSLWLGMCAIPHLRHLLMHLLAREITLKYASRPLMGSSWPSGTPPKSCDMSLP